MKHHQEREITVIDLKQARELSLRAMETQGPDFVYNPDERYICFYTRVTTPDDSNDPRVKTGCLVGVALDLAGETRHHRSMQDVLGLLRDFPDMMTPLAASYFQIEQKCQDSGETWGETRAAAEAWAVEVDV